MAGGIRSMHRNSMSTSERHPRGRGRRVEEAPAAADQIRLVRRSRSLESKHRDEITSERQRTEDDCHDGKANETLHEKFPCNGSGKSSAKCLVARCIRNARKSSDRRDIWWKVDGTVRIVGRHAGHRLWPGHANAVCRCDANSLTITSPATNPPICAMYATPAVSVVAAMEPMPLII